jgi:hypothetical protein
MLAQNDVGQGQRDVRLWSPSATQHLHKARRMLQDLCPDKVRQRARCTSRCVTAVAVARLLSSRFPFCLYPGCRQARSEDVRLGGTMMTAQAGSTLFARLFWPGKRPPVLVRHQTIGLRLFSSVYDPCPSNFAAVEGRSFLLPSASRKIVRTISRIPCFCPPNSTAPVRPEKGSSR